MRVQDTESDSCTHTGDGVGDRVEFIHRVLEGSLATEPWLNATVALTFTCNLC